jgi:3-deoxy-7-phosphoheptulonate synthase
MVIVMQKGATQNQIDLVISKIEEFGLDAHVSDGKERTIIGVIGDTTRLGDFPVESMAGVERAIAITTPYKLASRVFKEENTIVSVNGVRIGNWQIVVMAGPCAVESIDQIMQIAKWLRDAGAQFLRGGAFKPRSSPYSFQGLGEDGLKMLAEAKKETGLGIVTEVMTPNDVELVNMYADILQIGSRNMQNFSLLKEVGGSGKPVLLKRGMSATIEEWLLAAEYILSNGNPDVILCERGIRTFETYTRNTLDLNAVAVVKQLCHLPVIVDPSHGTGRRELVAPMAKAAIAAGADGLMIEVHHDPENSMSDGKQSLLPEQFSALMYELCWLTHVVGRGI